jgi:transposase
LRERYQNASGEGSDDIVPDHETIADFRKDNGRAIGEVCTRFVGLCREMSLLSFARVHGNRETNRQ